MFSPVFDQSEMQGLQRTDGVKRLRSLTQISSGGTYLPRSRIPTPAQELIVPAIWVHRRQRRDLRWKAWQAG